MDTQVQRDGKRKKGQRAKGVDWERVAAEYRAGQLSTNEIARRHGVDESAVRRRARRGGWVRDLRGRVKFEAANQIIREKIRDNTREDVVVHQAAIRAVDVVKGHLALAKRLKEVAGRNLDAIEAIQAGQTPGFDLVLGKGDGLATILTATVTTIQRAVEIDRKALSLDDEPVKEDEIARLADQFVRIVAAGNAIEAQARTDTD